MKNTTLVNLQHNIDSLESLLLDILAAVVPWLAPLIPAFIAYENMVNVLGFPRWLSLVSAIVIESLGLATVHTAFQFWKWNTAKRKNDPDSPVAIAAATGAFYLAIVLTVNVLLDASPLTHKAAKFLLSLISVAGAITLAIRSQHKAQVLNIQQEKAERRADNQARKVTGKLPESDGTGRKVTGTVTDWRKLTDGDRRKVAIMPTSEITARYKVSERTARNWRTKATSMNGVTP